MNLRNTPKKLIAILIIGLFLRVWGIDYGLPALYNCDEVPVVNTAMSFGRGSLEPLFYNYPTAYMYIVFLFYAAYFGTSFLIGAVSSSQEFLVQYLTNPTTFYLIARGVSAIAGTITIAITYLITKKAFNKETGLLASAFLAVSSLHVVYSHYALPETTMTLFSTISLYFVFGILKNNSYRNYILSGFFLGLATATKYTAGPLLISILTAHYIKTRNIKKVISKKLATAFLALATGFLLGSPYWLLSFEKFYAVSSSFSTQRWIGHAGNIGSMKWVWVIEQLIVKETIFGLLAIFAIGYAIKKHTNKDLVLLSAIFLYFSYIGAWTVKGAHYFMSIIPILCILLARWLNDLSKTKEYKNVYSFLLTITLLSGLFFSMQYGYMHSKTDTRDIALDYIESNIPSNSNIAVFSSTYSPQFKTKDDIIELNNKFKKYNIDIILDENIIDGPAQYIKTNIQVTENSTIWPETWDSEEIKKYNEIEYVKFVYKHRLRPIEELKSLGVQYIILSSHSYTQYIIDTKINPKNPLYPRHLEFKTYYQTLLNNHYECVDLIKFFDNNQCPGPKIHIYEIL